MVRLKSGVPEWEAAGRSAGADARCAFRKEQNHSRLSMSLCDALRAS